MPKSGVYSGYAPGQVGSWPYYGVGARLAASPAVTPADRHL